MATMNLFMCLPELLVSLVISPAVAALGGSLRVPLVVGAIACCGALAAVFLGFKQGWRGSWCSASTTPQPRTLPA